MTQLEISVIGLGYIGLPTAAVFASRKLRVTGIDINPETVSTINRGLVHIVEPDLDQLVQQAVAEGFLRASINPVPADAFLIAVPTPFADDYRADLGFVEAAARAIAPVLAVGNIVILESTCPVGATEQMAAWLAEARPDLSFPQHAGETSDIRIAHCPERVLPGHVLRELVENDRVIGGMTSACADAAAGIYKAFVTGECVLTDARTAEMCKLTENSFRDVNIAFANELSVICDKLHIDVWELIRLANRHPRVNILQPGPGVGGHCIAVDPWFIVSSAPEQARLIRTAREVNDGKPDWVFTKVMEAVAGCQPRSKRPVVACLGLAFKANIDDLRESPALSIARRIAASDSCTAVVVEPHIDQLPTGFGPEAQLLPLDAALVQADIVVLLVDHLAFREVLPEALASKVIIDTRGFWTAGEPVDHATAS